MRSVRFLLGSALLFVALAPAPARADVFLTPFAGLTFGGDAPDPKFNAGAALTWMGGGVAGVELDVSYTPDFFGDDPNVIPLIADNHLMTVMGNVVIGVPVGGQSGAGVRPYVAAGLGLVRTRLETADAITVTDNELGMNAGGGVLVFASDHVGLRADVRYFRLLRDPEDDDDIDLVLTDFDFWRATVGVNIRF